MYELKERANNLILFAPQTLQHDFAAYNTFLNKLNPDEFVIYGKSTQNIPLIVELAAIEAETEEESNLSSEAAQNHEETQQAIVTAEDEQKKDEEKPDDFSDESNSYSYETLIEDTAPVQKEEHQEQNTAVDTENYSYEKEKEEAAPSEIQVAPEQISNIIDAEIEQEKAELPKISIQEPEIAEPEFGAIQQESVEPEPVSEQIIESKTQNEIVEEGDEEEGFPEVLGVPEPQVETISALEPLAEEVHEDDLLMNPIIEEPMDMPVLEYNDDSLPIITEPEIVEEENPVDKVAKDVDELLFSQEKQEIPPIDEIEEPETDLTEDDLNFIEDINNVEEKPPVVPVYPTEDLGEAPAFEQGDRVTHPKYGEGVVEKMIKYGNKTLCSINFVNVGRRLLDPAISEMSKVN